MFQIRIHGRGGQGVVTGAKILSVAAFLEGHHAQAFSSFGSERAGTPVAGFCRIADKEIRLREPVMEPDCLIVLDPTLFQAMDVLAGLKAGGYLLVNSKKTFAGLNVKQVADALPAGHAAIVPATEFGLKHTGKPMPNAPLLGAFAALTGLVQSGSIQQAIAQAFPGGVGEANIAAAKQAYELVTNQVRAASAA